LSNEGQYAVAANPNLTHTNFAKFLRSHYGCGCRFVYAGGKRRSICQRKCFGARPLRLYPTLFTIFLPGALPAFPAARPSCSLLSMAPLWALRLHCLPPLVSGCSFTPFGLAVPTQQSLFALPISRQQRAETIFALDDIAFRQQCFTSDSVYIRVANLQPGINKVIKLGCTKDTVDFTALNLGGDVPSQYKWDFGDGTASQLQNPQHIYLAQGQYTIKLVTKKNGCADSTTIQIDTRHPILAAFTVDHDSVCIGTPIQVAQTDAVTGPGTYYWNFGDGQTDNLPAPAAHSYTTPGIYTILHVISDQIPCHDTARTKVSVFPSPFSTFDIVDTVFCLGGATTVTGTATPGFSKLNWNFGDGHLLEPPAIHPSHSLFGLLPFYQTCISLA